MTKLSLDELIIPAPPYRMARPVATLAAEPAAFDPTQTMEFKRPPQEKPPMIQKPETVTRPIEKKEQEIPKAIFEARTLVEQTEEQRKNDPPLAVLGKKVLTLTESGVVKKVFQEKSEKPPEAKPAEDLTAGMSETAKANYLKAKAAGQNVTAYETAARQQLAFEKLQAQKATEAEEAKKVEEERIAEENVRAESVKISTPEVKGLTIEEERESLIRAKDTMKPEEYQRRLAEYNRFIAAGNAPLPVEKAPAVTAAPPESPAPEKTPSISELEAQRDRLIEVAETAKKEGDQAKASVALEGGVRMGQRIARMRAGSEPETPKEPKPVEAQSDRSIQVSAAQAEMKRILAHQAKLRAEGKHDEAKSYDMSIESFREFLGHSGELVNGSESEAPEEPKPVEAPKEDIDKQHEEAIRVEKMRQLEKEQLERRRAQAQPEPDLEDLDMRPVERPGDVIVGGAFEDLDLQPAERSRTEAPVMPREKSEGIISGVMSAAEWALRKTGADAARPWLDTLMPRLKSVYHRQFAERRAYHQEKAQGSLKRAQEKFTDFKAKMDDSGWPLKKYYAWRVRVWDKAIEKREGLVNRHDAFREKRVKRHNELQRQVADRYERELAPFRGKQEALKRDQKLTQEILKTLETQKAEALKLLAEAEGKRKGFFSQRGKAAANKIRVQAKEIEQRINDQRKMLERIEKPLASATAKIQKYESRQKQFAANMKFLEMENLKGVKRAKPATSYERTESSAYTTQSSEGARVETGHPRDGEQWSAAAFAETWNKNGLTRIEDTKAFTQFIDARQREEGITTPATLGEILPLAQEYFKANRLTKKFLDDKKYFLSNVPKK